MIDALLSRVLRVEWQNAVKDVHIAENIREGLHEIAYCNVFFGLLMGTRKDMFSEFLPEMNIASDVNLPRLPDLKLADFAVMDRPDLPRDKDSMGPSGGR
jgi:hypothetical protein